MVEGADEGAHNLLPVGPAENMGVGGDVGAVPGMAVIVDDGAGVMKEAGGKEEIPHAVIEMMRFLPLVEHGKSHGGDVGGMEIVFQRKGVEVVLHRGNEHVLFPVPFLIVNGVIVVEEEAFPKAAAGDGEVRGTGFPHDFLYHQGTGNDNVRPLFRKSGDFLPFFIGLSADGFHQGKEVFHRKVVVMEFRQGIGGRALVHLGQVADRTAYADDFHGLLGEPGDFR